METSLFEQMGSTGSHNRSIGSTSSTKREIKRAIKQPLSATGIVCFLQFVPKRQAVQSLEIIAGTGAFTAWLPALKG